MNTEPTLIFKLEYCSLSILIPSMQMGVHQMGIRAQLLKSIETTREETERAKLKAKELEVSIFFSFI